MIENIHAEAVGGSVSRYWRQEWEQLYPGLNIDWKSGGTVTVLTLTVRSHHKITQYFIISFVISSSLFKTFLILICQVHGGWRLALRRRDRS